MAELTELLTTDGQIMKLRALGYSQNEIAKRLKISQSAVSQRFNTIRKRSIIRKNDDVAFWELFMGIGAAKLLEMLFDESFRKGVENVS